MGRALAAACALFSGWGIPTQRTVLMLAMVVALRWSARQWLWGAVWTRVMVMAMAMAMVMVMVMVMAVVLLLDPWALRQPGFWLSFVAVGILFASSARVEHGDPLDEPQHRWRRWGVAALGLLREQATITVAIAPLSLMLFGQVSLVVTPLALAGVMLPLLWDAAALAVQGLGMWLTWLAQWPWAAVFRAIPPAPLALAGVLWAQLLVLRLPWAVCPTGVVLIWPLLAWQPPRPAAGEFEVMAIEVGQGSAVLVRTANHALL